MQSMYDGPQTEPRGLNKQVFMPGDRCRVKTQGIEALGEVIGVSKRHIFDVYIVLLDEMLPEYPWRAITVMSPDLEKVATP